MTISFSQSELGPNEIAARIMAAEVQCILPSAETFSARLTNISPAGFNLLGNHASLERAQRLVVDITSPVRQPSDPLYNMQVGCEVLWSRPAEAETAFGVRYMPMPAEDMRELVRFVFRNFGIKLWEWPDKREHPRVSRKLVCHIIDAEHRMQIAMLRDISVTGIGLLTNHPIPEGFVARFRFAVGEDMMLERFGKVVRSRKTEEGYDLGIAFLDMDDAKREEILKALQLAVKI
jgi:c-di-GMP-binding flagellar brake protein YcgR